MANPVASLTGLVLLLGVTAVTVGGCYVSAFPVSATPTATEILTHARRVNRELESYRAVSTTTETTLHRRTPGLDFSETTTVTVDVASASVYRVAHDPTGHEYVRINGTSYSRTGDESWAETEFKVFEDDLLPGVPHPLPPSHPMEWLGLHSLVSARIVEEPAENNTGLFIIEGISPMLPGGAGNDPGLPQDIVRLHIDADTFLVLRIKIDHNIRDDLRADSGYRVIPGLVEVETSEVIDLSRFNSDIDIRAPIFGASS